MMELRMRVIAKIFTTDITSLLRQQHIRFLTNNNVDDADTVYIVNEDPVIKYLGMLYNRSG
ncbi:MAG: hypothetical protein IPI88_10730 [Chitinophagaceae bacterium]|nr:hypothetical protein [Chitinophagaceae bacterium]